MGLRYVVVRINRIWGLIGSWSIDVGGVMDDFQVLDLGNQGRGSVIY